MSQSYILISWYFGNSFLQNAKVQAHNKICCIFSNNVNETFWSLGLHTKNLSKVLINKNVDILRKLLKKHQANEISETISK